MMQLETTFRAIDEPQPGEALAAIYSEYAPAYRRWFMREGEAARPALAQSRQMLRDHMPELAILHEDLCDLVGAGHLDARLLALYRPPPMVRGCSQAAVVRDGRAALVRNYDHAPHLCDAVILRARWLGVGTIVSTDCLWGALDGVSDAGLAVALAFGGDRATGDGFAASLVVRYLLQTCDSVAAASAALSRLPVAMPYTFALLDAAGRGATVHVGPGRAARVTDTPVSTNHQDAVAWPAYERFVESCARHEYLSALLHNPESSLEAIIARFLDPPLFRTQWSRGSGTLYTLVCEPSAGTARYVWPQCERSYGFAAFAPEAFTVTYRA
ncbi:MAG: hypothetical protein KF757_08090 [Phycisphaeraceae bacterium]|nr:hypothetical protein [Phycisphaeraceae bacterium]MCW5762715.1 hypothetical protein [Phycisphaeraceae bacterium]